MEKEFNHDLHEDSQELYEHYRLIIDKRQSPIRIDKFLMDRLENASRTKIQSAAKSGNILVNNRYVKSNYKIKPDDEIRILLPHPRQEFEVIAENIPLSIEYEDKDILLINKAAGMVVHPGHGNRSGTLLNAVKYYLQENDPKAESLMVHRTDKNTSGLLLMAKNEIAQTHLASQFYHHSIRRSYTAMIWGDVEKDEGTIEANIGRNPKDRKMMTVFPEGDKGKSAITHYKVIERFGYVTILECRLETGRTHQIRAHMKYLGHPVFNDEKYGGDRIKKGTTFSKYKQFIENAFKLCPRQALHAKTIDFIHPSTQERINFESELPNDIQSVIDKWRKYAHASIQSKQNPPKFMSIDFNHIANQYDQYYDREFGYKVDIAEKRTIKKYLQQIPEREGLEIGCGTGHWTMFYSDHGFQITGIDLAMNMLQKAIEKNIPGATFTQMDATNLLFGNESVKNIFSITTSEFVNDKQKFFDEAYRVLKRGGYLLMGELNANSKLGKDREQDPIFKDADFYTPETFQSYLNRFGHPEIKGCALISEHWEILDYNENHEIPQERLNQEGALLVGFVKKL